MIYRGKERKLITADGSEYRGLGFGADEDKEEALPLAKRFHDMGFNLETTTMTAEYMKEHGIRTRLRRKLSEHRVTMFTSLDTVRVLLDVLEEMTIGVEPL